MKVLILTDHRKHTASNSLYALARALRADTRVVEVRVASRGTAANAAFFACEEATALRAVKVGEGFAYQPGGGAFAELDEGAGLLTELGWAGAVVLRVPHPVPGGGEGGGHAAAAAGGRSGADRPRAVDSGASPVPHARDWFHFLRAAFGLTPIVNRPAGIAATTTKAWLLNLPELCAPMALCERPAEVAAFAKTRDAVLKPLEGYGGVGVIRIRDGHVEVPSGVISLADWPRHPLAARPYLAMEYLRRVGEGDKRIVVVGDRVLGAVLRVPAPGTWLCNVAQGGHAEPAGVSFAERRILDALAPRMAELGIVMYGADTLVGNEGHRVLSEVNTMSIGGLDDLPPTEGRSAAAWAAAGILDAVTASLPETYPRP